MVSGQAARVRRSLTEAERKRGLLVLMLSTLLAWGGFFMVQPLLGIHFVDGLGWTAASIGVALALRQFLQQGLTIFSGAFADRVGAKSLIALGTLVRAAGFAALAWADTYPLLLAAVIVAALGGALFESPKSAAIAALTTEAERPRYFAMTGVIIGIGIALGTQLGAFLLRYDFDLVALASAGCYLVLFVMHLVFLPTVDVAEGEGGFWHGFGMAIHDRQFVTYVALMSGNWYLSTQFFLTMPLAATALTGSVESVAIVTGINSAVALLLAYPLPRLVHRWTSPGGALIAGIVLTAVGLALVGLAPNALVLYGAVLLFSMGTTLVRPNEQTVTAKLANRNALGSYFGVASLSVAIGGGLGNIMGGFLYDLGQSLERPALAWLVCCAIGLVTAFGLWTTLRADRQQNAPARPIPSVR